MSEQDETVRDMAAHRGFRVVKSRRRTPGGDFGRYGLKESGGKPAFGFEGDALTATAQQVRSFLRDSTRATWTKSAGSAKPRRAAPKLKPEPKHRPKPRFKPKVANLLDKLPAAKRAEAFTELLARRGMRLERIVSRGQATPEKKPMVQERDEWVLLLQGSAGIRIEDSAEVSLAPGDHLLIAAGQ